MWARRACSAPSYPPKHTSKRVETLYNASGHVLECLGVSVGCLEVFEGSWLTMWSEVVRGDKASICLQTPLDTPQTLQNMPGCGVQRFYMIIGAFGWVGGCITCPVCPHLPICGQSPDPQKITCWAKSAHSVAPSRKFRNANFLAPIDSSRRAESIGAKKSSPG